VHADKGARFINLAEHQGDVLVGIDIVAISDHLPHAELGREPRFRDAVNEPLRLEPVGNQLSHRNERQPVKLRELLELRAAGCRAVVIEHFANYAGRIKTSETRKIYSGLGVPDALKHSAVPRAERRDMTGTPKVGGDCRGIYCNLNRSRAVLRADARSHAESRGSVDAHGEGRTLLLGIFVALLRKLKLVSTLTGEGQADPAPGLFYHEVDELGRNELSRANEVALVLAVLIVCHEDKLSRLDVGDRLLDGSESHCHASSPLAG